jgi:hypothetical protein
MIRALLLITVLAVWAPAFAQDRSYDWTPEQFTEEGYFVRMVRAVGDRMEGDLERAVQCDALMRQRIDATRGADRLFNAAIWTSFVVRAGNLRSAGEGVSPELDELIRAPLTLSGMDTPVGRAFMERMRASPGGVEARTAECTEIFGRAAGAERAYFEQRARFLADQADQANQRTFTDEQLASATMYRDIVVDAANRIPLGGAETLECEVLTILEFTRAPAGRERRWAEQMFAAFVARERILVHSGETFPPDLTWIPRIRREPAILQGPEVLAWRQRVAAMPGGEAARLQACQRKFDQAIDNQRRYFEQRAEYMASH